MQKLFHRAPILIAIILLPTLILSCSDDEDGSTDAPVYFSLLITNKTPNDFHLYQSPTEAGEEFRKTGFVLSNVNYRINQLRAGETYTFRLVRDGMEISAYDYEKSFTSDGEERSWTVN